MNFLQLRDGDNLGIKFNVDVVDAFCDVFRVFR